MARKEAGGKGGVENFAKGGHLQQPLPKSPSLHPCCPFTPHVAEEGEATERCVYPRSVSSVLMSESYDQAGKPLWLLLWLCF